MKHAFGTVEMLAARVLLAASLLAPCFHQSSVSAQQVGQSAKKMTPSREEWGAPAVRVSHRNGKWDIAGKTNRLTLSESDLSMHVQALV